MMSEVIMASLDQDSATSGIQEAIDALGERGGSVRIPAGNGGYVNGETEPMC